MDDNKIKKVDAVWLGAAVLTYNLCNKKEEWNLDDIYFVQADIVRAGVSIIGENIPATLASQQCSANTSYSVYNYLTCSDKKRRISYNGEFNGQKERPIISKDIVISTEHGETSVEELVTFIEEEYTPKVILLEEEQLKELDFKIIFDYLEQYVGKKYADPEKAGDQADIMRVIKEKGTSAREMLVTIGRKIQQVAPIYSKLDVSGWVNQGRSIDHYLWAELRKFGKEDSPTSMSIFIEKNVQELRLRVSVEARDSKCLGDNNYKYMLHNKLLMVENNNPELSYYVEGESSKEVAVSNMTRQELMAEIKANKFKKVQICKVMTRNDVLEAGPEKTVKFIKQAISELEAFYDKAVEEYKSNKLENNPEGEIDMSDKVINKNMILYGPPGTGKTYNTVLYAVSICDGIEITELEKKPYEDVLSRYKDLKDKEKRIAFTTFHQSYGYEEFIEGIKPILVDSDSSEDDFEKLEYSIKPGIFKEFCERAKEKTISYSFNSDVKKNPTVWKVSLEGSKSTPTKSDCFDNYRIRIGWPERDRYITDESEVYSAKERRILLDFQSEMQKGDLVVTLYDQFTIDGIGVVDGDYEWLEDGEKFPRCRKVKWLAKDIREDIKELNHGKAMTSSTVYRLKVPPEEILKLAEKNNHEAQVEVNNNQDNYVMIIDEINRGNISKIFGELITLIETTKREGEDEAMEAQLPYSGEPFSVPNNVYILGTMNTADRSIALMDTALRRRFEFDEMMPKSSVLTNLGINMIEGIDIVRMLDTINERIEYLFDREHKIGHAYFTPLAEEKTINKLANIFQNAIIPLLQEYFYEDYSKIQLVLGDNGKEKDEFKFILDSKVNIKSIFKGDVSEVDDLSDKKYKIQKEAFYIAESYKQIY